MTPVYILYTLLSIYRIVGVLSGSSLSSPYLPPANKVGSNLEVQLVAFTVPTLTHTKVPGVADQGSIRSLKTPYTRVFCKKVN